MKSANPEKMQDKNFTANVRRVNVQKSKEIGLPLAEFLSIFIPAVEEIPDQIGLVCPQ